MSLNRISLVAVLFVTVLCSAKGQLLPRDVVRNINTYAASQDELGKQVAALKATTFTDQVSLLRASLETDQLVVARAVFATMDLKRAEFRHGVGFGLLDVCKSSEALVLVTSMGIDINSLNRAGENLYFEILRRLYSVSDQGHMVVGDQFGSSRLQIALLRTALRLGLRLEIKASKGQLATDILRSTEGESPTEAAKKAWVRKCLDIARQY